MTLADLLDRLQKTKGSGTAYTALCPAHEDKERSLSVAEKDGKLLLNCHAGCDTKDVLAALDLTFKDLFIEPPSKSRAKNAKRRIKDTYDYRSDTGALLYQVVRYEPKGFAQRRPDSDDGDKWIWNLQGVDRVLYRLPEIIEAIEADKKIFLVEGEKDADNMAKLDLQATTNAGGSSKWLKTYTTILGDATVIIIPDNDGPGAKHATRIRKALKNSVILNLPGLSEKQDVSDWIAAGGGRKDLIALARAALEERDSEPDQVPAVSEGDKPFIPLGYNRGVYFFLSHRTKQVVTRTAAGLKTKTNFLELAPLNWWELKYSSERGPDWTLAADNLIRDCVKAGLFDADRQRGRGAWWDEERTVLHQGDRLIVDGETVELLDHVSRYIYERGPRLHIPHKAAVTADDGKEFIRLCEMLTWETFLSSTLLAGWCAVAPISGVLRWRPHIWLTGPSGCGKTWVIEHIVGGLLGDMALKVQSVTTEAGLRQILGTDARPVLFDEAELEDVRGQMNIQRVLELARQASSESGATIIKGTSAGLAMQFSIRSCFALSSIGVGVKRHADETRVTVLTMDRPTADFDAIQGLVADLEAQEFGAGMIARSCRLANVIRANAETFAIAVQNVANSRRIGDQIGTLLAGYWSLRSDDEIPLDQAMIEVEKVAPSFEELTPAVESADEMRCLRYILEQKVRVELAGGGPTVDRSVGELLDADSDGSGDVSVAKAQATLKRNGIFTDVDGVFISTSHSGVAKLLEGSPWHQGWSHYLRRIHGAQASKKTIRFPGGGVSRATFIPWKALRAGAESEETTAEVPF